jgi:polyphenol oxidase
LTGAEGASPIASAIRVNGFTELGVVAFTTTRAAGSFGLGSDEPVASVMERWSALLVDCRAAGAPALATAGQVHGAEVERHGGGWQGWLRGKDRDGHLTTEPGVALAVTVADCTPVFLAHPAGPIAVLHAGWRGTAAGILERGIAALRAVGAEPGELRVHLGPSICGACYEVGPEVVSAVTGKPASGKARLDVRAVLAERATGLGVRSVSVSRWCTRCDTDRLFSHRGGDAGRQLGVILRPGPRDPKYGLP